MREILLATIVLVSTPALGGQDCAATPDVPKLETQSGPKATLKDDVAALLRDAETIYREADHLIVLRPRSETAAEAVSKLEAEGFRGESFHKKECLFQSAETDIRGKIENENDRLLLDSIIRIEQFDNFIFNAVNEMLICKNTGASFDLNLSRQLLDHAIARFKGDENAANWNPDDLDGPQSNEGCENDERSRHWPEILNSINNWKFKYERLRG